MTIRYELLSDASEAADLYHVGLLDIAKLRRKAAKPPAKQPAEAVAP